MASSRSRTAAPLALTATVAAWLALAGQPITPRHDHTDDAARRTDGATATLLIDVADHLTRDEQERWVRSVHPDAALNSAWSVHEGLYRVELSARDATTAMDTLRRDPNVEYVEIEQTYVAQGVNDPLYPFQWNLDQIRIEPAWARSRGRGAVVAVLDTGVAYRDEPDGPLTGVRDLAGTRFAPGYDFVDNDTLPLDLHGHGTHVAGTIAQTTDNAYGVAGVAPAATIMPIRVLDAQGRGRTADIAEGIRWAADHGAHIINMSLGGPIPSVIMADAIDYAHRRGVTVIAAAGNSASPLPSYPAAYRHVIAVAATQYDRTTTPYSNYGRAVDIAAPGGNTRVDQNNDGRPDGILQETVQASDPTRHEFALFQGTSMAAPHVAGVAALLHGAGVQRPERIEAALIRGASREVPNYSDARYGAGLLDARATVRRAATRYQLPRAALAAALLMLVVAAARRPLTGASTADRGRTRGSTTAAALTAVLVATGLAIPTLLLGSVGLHIAPLHVVAGGAPVHLLPGALGTSALLWSALPAIGLYAAFGHLRGPTARGVLVGALVGISAALLGEAIAPLIDVRLIPGRGLVEQLWLTVNAGVTLLIARAACSTDGARTS